MSTISLYWNLLRFKGNLPDEIITIILYHFGGMRHPIVNLLLDKTRINAFEELQQRPFIHNLLLEYKNTGCTEKFQNNLLNEQKNYCNMNSIRHCVIYKDIGYFLPRKPGILYYELKDKFSIPLQNWKLHRSKKILNNIKCYCGYSYWKVNRFLLERMFNYNYTEILQYLEKKKNFTETYVCKACFNTAFIIY